MKCLSVLHKLFAPLLLSALYSSGFRLLVQLLSIATGNGTGFNPDGQVTREELATFLYRYAKATGAGAGTSGSLSGFSDGGAVSGWASEAMQWAVGAGIIGGSNGKLNPSSPATRAEVATILMRFCQNLAK